MIATTTAIAAIGVGIAGYGAYSSSKAASESTKTQQKASASNAAFSQKVTDISQKQEDLRKAAMLLSSANQTRNVIRNTQIARSTALSRASSQGALNSSALGGAYGQIAGQSAEQLNQIKMDTEQGLTNFDLNAKLLQVQNANAKATGEFNSSLARSSGASDFGKSLFNTGATLVGNSQTLGNNISSVSSAIKSW